MIRNLLNIDACSGCTWHDCQPCVRDVYQPHSFADAAQSLLAKPHLSGLLRDSESVADLGPGSPSGSRFTDSDSLQFGSLRAGEDGAADTRNGGVAIDGATDGDAEQEVGGSGVHVHASSILDDAEEVKGS